ncbi:uncharacterized protein LOC133178223 [Saccostrea echinata]|uniref:uncharacterized protein LOC133178223 n=1 Tax=Saccostrea echinata TaxID=191078 RepID=UPI002A81FF54|nr:uncharacterized protein LOC133178223 [Saccostrea echinata]
MDPCTSAQDVMRCNLCETAVVEMHCDTCLFNMCKACVGEHMISDEFQKHEIVRFTLRKSTILYPECSSHVKERCEMYCNQCDIPVCVTCLASDQHLGHKLLKILQVLEKKKEKINKEQTELNDTIYPTYQDIASDVQNRMSQLEKEYGDLSTAITKHGENCHQEITKHVKKLKAEVDEMKNSQLQTLQKHLDEINENISEIKDEINSNDVAVNSNDISKVFTYTSDINRHRNLPEKILISLPKFTPGRIQGAELSKFFGTLSSSSLTSKKQGYSMKTTLDSPEAGSSPPVKQLLDEPEIVITIDTEYTNIRNVACLSDEEIWTSGQYNNTMKLYSINQGSLLKSITTKSGDTPANIAVTKSGDLIYTDWRYRTVNIVKNKEIEEMIRLTKCNRHVVCSTFSGDLLVVMDSDDVQPSKIVRYSGSTEKQTIQFDDKGKPLYSSGPSTRHITESRNLDICVSDCEAGAVVVVNRAGKLRFRYTGHIPASKNKPFSPLGITTDSQSHILTADKSNDCVHIIDQDGQFLCYINCGLRYPWGLCTDINDYLYVSQYDEGQVKKIRYLQYRPILVMDPRTSAQDVMRCDLCETAVVQMHCDTCLVNLCKACVGEHMLSDESKKHELVPFKLRKSTLLYPGCQSHVQERCEMYCNQCDIQVCATCLASDQHIGHKLLKVIKVIDEKKENIIKEQIELNETIYPTYQDIASDVQNIMSQLEKEYGDVSTAITKHGEDWHREIDKHVMKLKAEVDEMKNTQLQTLQKHLNEINNRISEIKTEISSFDVFLDSKDISKIFNVTSKIDRHRNLPEKIVPSLPKFTPERIEGEELCKIFGALIASSSLTSDKHGYSMKTTQKSPEAGSSPPVKQLLDEPETVSTIDTGYEYLINVACLSDEEIWTSGKGNTMKLYSINQGSLLKSITTKSGKTSNDIAGTKSGDLVYTDYGNRTVNILKNEKIEEVIRLQNWEPLGVCNTSSGDLLVIMYSNDYKQTKVVRYSGSTEKQTIQFDDKGKPLYSSGNCYRFITENRNLDICASDKGAKAVVVVNQAGKLRFRYTGHTPAPKNKPFGPRGITTDSQSHILTADDYNDCVHIIDQDGQFLCYIDCGLSEPMGLCTDTNDNLFAAQYENREVKKIKYLQ